MTVTVKFKGKGKMSHIEELQFEFQTVSDANEFIINNYSTYEPTCANAYNIAGGYLAIRLQVVKVNT